MADDPTIEEAVADVRHQMATAERLPSLRGTPRSDDWVAVSPATLRTLLAYIASLEERVEEAKRLMKPFAEAAENLDDTNDFDDDELWEHAAAMGLHVRDLRALAAFVNEKET